MKKIILVLLLVSSIFALTGCGEYQIQTEVSDVRTTSDKLEENYQNLNVELPNITRSLELENIKRRAEFINNPDLIGYLYLLDNGILIREVQVLGKVSSLNSYISPQEVIVDYKVEVYGNTSDYITPVLMQAPDVDGSYGSNSDGIFWFTPDGIYQEWSGDYMYSQSRLTFNIQPMLIEIGGE